MFHRFHVNRENRNYLRFLWWEKGDTNSEPKEYRMKVHLFGAASSPGCANYGMKFLASENEKEYPSAANFIKKNFYVDDGLISVESADEAIQLVKETQTVCVQKGNCISTSLFPTTGKSWSPFLTANKPAEFMM